MNNNFYLLTKKMMINEVQIIPVKPRNGLIAFASVLYNNSLFLGSIAIHSKLDGSGFRLTYPTKKVFGKDMNLFHPINRELSREIEHAIFTKLKNVMNDSNDRYS